jgi:ankyrin repeat protein
VSAQELFEAIDRDDREAARAFVSADPSLAKAPSATGASALLHAVYRDRRAIVAILEVAGPPLDVFEAAALGRVERLEALLALDPALANAWSPDGFTPLQLASFFNRPEAAALLVEGGADIEATARNDFRVRPLHSAVASRSYPTIDLLLEHGADPNARQQGGFTPLHEAAHHGDLRIIETLLAHGADPSARNEAGQTALEIAVAEQHDHAAALLREGGSA